MMRFRDAVLFALLVGVPGDAAADQVAILDKPEDAIIARINILDAARDSIDILYFSIHDDSVTRAALGFVREKALAGVRVRFITAASGFDVDPALLYLLQSLDSVEIRLYNTPSLSKPLRFLRQLHDKLILVDGERYITGGRNLGEVYFDLAAKKNKKDRDIYVIGETARTAQNYFNELWNSSEVTLAPHKPYSTENMAPQYCESLKKVSRSCVKKFEQRTANVRAQVEAIEEAVALTKADPIYQDSIVDLTPYLTDIPNEQIEFVHDPVEAENRHVGDVLERIVQQADGEVLVQSPYVVPERDLFELMELKKAEGVPFTFVTNSSKSTVNILSQAGYQRYRKRMLDAGAVFIESTGTYMLHAKSLVARSKDGSCVGGIGSFNVDPRSGWLNTETFVLIRNCEFADSLEQIIRSYAVDGIVLASRDDLKKLKALKKEVPFLKRLQISIFKFLTPLYRSQL